VKRLHWTIIVLGICVVSISSLVLRVDDPLTAYDESETPVYLATSVSTPADASTHLIVERPIGIVRGHRTGWDVAAMRYATIAKNGVRPSHSALKLPCPLLC
jgi:hypothetical protein